MKHFPCHFEHTFKTRIKFFGLERSVYVCFNEPDDARIWSDDWAFDLTDQISLSTWQQIEAIATEILEQV